MLHLSAGSLPYPYESEANLHEGYSGKISDRDVYKRQEGSVHEGRKRHIRNLQLIKLKIQTEGGGFDMCKAIKEMLRDSRQEGRKEGRQEGQDLSLIHI